MINYRNNDNQPSRLPARLDYESTAKVLGFESHDIRILVQKKLLKPLGNPEQQCRKYFALVEVLDFADSPAWLAKATNAVNEHWRLKNQKKRKHPAAEELATTE